MSSSNDEAGDEQFADRSAFIFHQCIVMVLP